MRNISNPVTIHNNENRTFEKLTEQCMKTIKQTSKEILEHLIGLAENISDENFTQSLPVLLNNSIGKQYRHIIEFFQVMLEGIEPFTLLIMGFHGRSLDEIRWDGKQVHHQGLNPEIPGIWSSVTLYSDQNNQSEAGLVS